MLEIASFANSDDEQHLLRTDTVQDIVDMTDVCAISAS